MIQNGSEPTRMAIAPRFGRRGGVAPALAALLLAALGAAGVYAQSPPEPDVRPRAGGAPCLRADETAGAVRVDLVSRAPAALCEPSFQIIELRNDSRAALGDAWLSLTPPLGAGRMRFEPAPGASGAAGFEISTDDGATWRAVGLPLGAGSEDDPLLWTQAEAQPLARLGPAGSRDDSVLLRWRGSLGEAFGSQFSTEARMSFSAGAVDACGRNAESGLQLATLSVLRPRLSAELAGRNLTRGGEFSDRVPAAPGDEIEWRVTLENSGEALAREARARISRQDGPVAALGAPDAPERFDRESGVVSLEPVVVGGRRAISLRETVTTGCVLARTRVEPSWGCAPAPRGDLSAVVNPLSQGGVAVLAARPDPALIRVEQSMQGVDGQPRPGDRAEIRVLIANDGPPIFSPELISTLPDGYVFDAAAPVALFADSGFSLSLSVAVDASRPEAPVLRLIGAGGAPGALNAGEQAQIAFQARRVRASLLETDEIVAELRFRDGCGGEGGLPPARQSAAPRQARLEAVIESPGSPIVGGAGATQRFAARLRNTGEEIARAPRLEILAGDGWAPESPPGCRAAPPLAETAGFAGRYLCELGENLPTGAETRFEFSLRVGPLGGAGEGVLAVAIEAAAGEPDSSDAADDPGALARARAESGAVGFSLTQRLLDETGAPRDPADPIDLGELVLVEFEARWFGVGAGGVGEALSGVSVAQTLPPTLGFRNLARIGGDIQLTDALAPPSGASGRVLWSLEPFAGDGRFIGRLTLEAIEPPAPPPLAVDAVDAARASSETLAAIETNAVFQRDGRSFGLDPLEQGPTDAEPLTLFFRRPDMRLEFTVDGRQADGEGYWVVRGGERLEASVLLSNAGAAPGFMDWVRLGLPDFLKPLPMERDGLDNDGDGEIDEGGEAAGVVVEQFAKPGAGSGGRAQISWTALPGAAGGSVAGMGQRLGPGAAARFRVAFDVDPSLPPDTRATLALDGRFAARLYASESDQGRSRIERRPALRSPPVSGFLLLSRTSVGGDLDSRVAHGETVEHRLTIRLPAGLTRDPVARVDLPPALQDVAAVGYRIGPGLDCPQARTPEVEQEAGGRRRLIWPLGDCRGGLEASDEVRLALLDFTARLVDADPAAPPPARALWRDALVEAGLSYEGAEGPRRAALGDSALRLGGPLIAVERPEAAAVPSGLDAGDTFETLLLARNVGDRAALGLDAGFGAPTLAGFDCAAMRVWSEAGVAAASGCGVGFSAPDLRLEPGEAVEIHVSGRLASDAPMDSEVSAPAVIRSWAEGRPRDPADAARIQAAALTLRTPPPPAPALEAAVISGARGDEALAAPANVAIGDFLRLRGSFALPEGGADIALTLRARLASAGGAPAEAPPILRLRAAKLSRDRDDAVGARSPGGLDRAAPGAEVDAAAAVEISVDAEGWTRLTVPLGAFALSAPRDGPGRAGFVLEALAELADAPPVSEGRALEAQALVELRGGGGTAGRRYVASSTAAVGRVVEPFLELAALNDDSDGAVQPGDRLVFEGVACNRGGAPAFALSMRATPPPGFSFDPERPPSFETADPAAPLTRRRYGRAEFLGGKVIGRPDGVAASIAPGRCAALRAPMILRAAGGSAAAARFEILGYQGRPSGARPGRRYGGGLAAETRVTPRDLMITAPERLEAAPGAPLALAFTVTAAETFASARLQLTLSSAAPLEWRIFVDSNRNGSVDGGDALWTDGATLPSGATMAFVALAQPPEDAPPGWRAAVLLRALAVTRTGRVLRGAREIALARREDRSGTMRAERVMAVDRDCDGALSDEITQDAVFEAVKEAAPGECVVMRLRFHNDGAASVEEVLVQDDMTPGARYLPGSARFGATPTGLVGGAVTEPRGPRGRLIFRFVGALAPGLTGAVEYRVRLEESG